MSQLKLLVVEDDPASLELMTEVFTSLKAEVRPMSDSEKASLLINQEKFDGIFLDLEMPKVNGFELARRIRHSSWNKSTPIVIVTGRDEQHTMQEVFALGATFFLQKPVDRQKLRILFRTVSGGMLENRRRNTRVPLQTEVICTLSSRAINGMTWNVSQGGMQVETEGLAPGHATKLAFRLPASGVLIEAMGTVIWANDSRQGVQFTKLSAECLQSLRKYIEEFEKE